MKHMKRHAISACLAALLLLSLAGCGANGSDSDSGNTSGTDYSNSTVSAQVQSIDGGSVTAIVGELSERQGGGQGGPNGQNTSGGAAGGPNLEGGQGDGTAPDESGGGEAPEPPEGDGQQPPELPDGGFGSDGVSGGAIGGGQAPEGAPAGGPGRSVFTANGETISFEISDSAAITLESRDGSSEGSLSDIQAGSILEIAFGDENTVAAVTVKSVPAGGPGGQPPDGAPAGINGSGSPDSNGSGTGSNSGDSSSPATGSNSGAASGLNTSGDSDETGE